MLLKKTKDNLSHLGKEAINEALVLTMAISTKFLYLKIS